MKGFVDAGVDTSCFRDIYMRVVLVGIKRFLWTKNVECSNPIDAALPFSGIVVLTLPCVIIRK